MLSISTGVVRGTGEELHEAADPEGHPGTKEMTQMFMIEEESGTITRSPRRHDGYYAGDFTGTPMCTASELSALAKLRLPDFSTKSGMPTDHRSALMRVRPTAESARGLG
ncbi:MAG TPA: hypothetical protein VLI04_03270 [Nocardioidaceae bacterium]|nr:hypothetical protein [Nocardioidaceae bacterium]